MRSTLSVLGLYNWDNTIFDDLEIPAGLDKSLAVYYILANCAELETLYSDSDFFRCYIGRWSAVKNITWTRKYKALNLEYNPLENYDRKETITERIENVDKAEAESTESGATYDSPNMTQTGAGTAVNTITTDHMRTLTNNTRGNIGVTTSQQMLESEINIANYNIYDIIMQDFKRDFCLEVY